MIGNIGTVYLARAFFAINTSTPIKITKENVDRIVPSLFALKPNTNPIPIKTKKGICIIKIYLSSKPEDVENQIVINLVKFSIMLSKVPKIEIIFL